MRLALLVLALLAVPAAAQVAQPVRATTTDGRAILVFPDGTWQEAPATIELDLAAPPPPPPPPAPPPAASASSRTLESASGDYAITYDASRWRLVSGTLNQEAEFELALPFGGAYAVTLYEVYPISAEALRDVVLNNVLAVTNLPVKVIREKTVQAEGGTVLRFEYEVVPEQGVPFTFITTVSGNDRGALQLITWSATSTLPRFREEMVRLHEGLALLGAGGP